MATECKLTLEFEPCEPIEIITVEITDIPETIDAPKERSRVGAFLDEAAKPQNLALILLTSVKVVDLLMKHGP